MDTGKYEYESNCQLRQSHQIPMHSNPTEQSYLSSWDQLTTTPSKSIAQKENKALKTDESSNYTSTIPDLI